MRKRGIKNHLRALLPSLSLSLFLPLFLCPWLAWSQLDYHSLKETDLVLKESHRHLSPSIGALPDTRKTLSFLYDQSEQNDQAIDPSSRLVKLLFHRPDEATFHASYLAGHPAKFLGAKDIGSLVVTLERAQTSNLASELEKSLLESERIREILSMEERIEGKVKFLREELNSLKKAFNSQYAELRKLERKYKGATMQKLSPSEKEQAEEELRSAKAFQTSNEFQENEKKIKEVELQIDDNKKELKAFLRDNLGTITPSRFRKHISELSVALKEAYEHVSPEKESIRGEEVQKILLGFLWDKVQSREELLSYYQELKALSALDRGREDFLNEGSEAQKKWIAAKFETDDLKDLPGPAAILPREFVTAYLLSRMDTIPLGRHELVPDKDDSSVTYTDCGENSLKNLFNIILYHQGKLDVSILERIPFNKLDPRIVEFYRTYNSPAKVLSRAARLHWNKLLSGLNGSGKGRGIAEGGGLESINYLTPQSEPYCEIGPGFKNLSLVLEKLTGESSFSDVIAKANSVLKEQGRSLHWDDSKLALDPQTQWVLGQADLMVESSKGKRNLELHFLDYHFFFKDSKQRTEYHQTPEQKDIQLFMAKLKGELGTRNHSYIEALSTAEDEKALLWQFNDLLKNPEGKNIPFLLRKTLLNLDLDNPKVKMDIFNKIQLQLPEIVPHLPQELLLSLGQMILQDATSTFSPVDKRIVLRVLSAFSEDKVKNLLSQYLKLNEAVLLPATYCL